MNGIPNNLGPVGVPPLPSRQRLNQPINQQPQQPPLRINQPFNQQPFLQQQPQQYQQTQQHPPFSGWLECGVILYLPLPLTLF